MTKLPMISFAVANFNGGAFLADAINGALGQRGVDVEVLIVDDRSTDDSWTIARRLAAADSRVRIFRLDRNSGPARARNRALREAHGEWLAILDSDDLIHPDRSRRLIDEAARCEATMIADDLLLFDQDDLQPPKLFLERRNARAPRWIDLASYLDQTLMFGRHPNLGFLKPMIRRDFLQSTNVTYDESLQIAEDDDFVLRLLLAGGRYRLLPRPMYFYRKHGSSISHRLSSINADRMMAAAERQRAAITAVAPHAVSAFDKRVRTLRAARGFSHLIDALKRRDAAAALRVASRTPSSLLLLRQPLAAAVARLIGGGAAAEVPAPTPRKDAVLFISRQRIVGATNGSSAYLIAIARAARDAGFEPHLLQPSPGLFGRTPFFRIRPEMAVFASHRIRGGRRFGDWMIATDPAVTLAAARGMLARLLRKARIGGPLSIDRKAPYAAAAPWQRDDFAFVSRYGREIPGPAIADYIFQSEALPYLLTPDRRTATLMHDLFSARTSQFGDAAADSVTALDEASEIELLGRTDAVLAIQQQEAAFVRDHVPKARAILAPMAADPVATATAGNANELLFVGSNTAPNIHGLMWFNTEVWPIIRAARPDACLKVAGRVAEAIDQVPGGVEMLGMVDDLRPLYESAGIVISPLLQGSGLKIKLVEAIAMGKACVVTGVTLQGVEEDLGSVVERADDPQRFAAAVIALQGDEQRRQHLADAALTTARRQFGPTAAYAEFTEWLSAAPN